MSEHKGFCITCRECRQRMDVVGVEPLFRGNKHVRDAKYSKIGVSSDDGSVTIWCENCDYGVELTEMDQDAPAEWCLGGA